MREKYYRNSPGNIIIKDITSSILELNDAFEFHRSLPAYSASPLIELRGLAGFLGVGNIYVKDESGRFGLKSFKVLGAMYAMHRILEGDPGIDTFCTATDGNHGLAVAWSARRIGKDAVVYVPWWTTENRISDIESEGATVIKVSGDYDMACLEADAACTKNRWKYIQDKASEGYEDVPALIMAGYLTLFRELENDIRKLPEPTIDVVFLQAGVGSMAASGIYHFISTYGSYRPGIVIVEPCEADGIMQSLRENKLTSSSGSGNTVMAGLNCATPSWGAWNLLRNGSDFAVSIGDDYTLQAMRKLYYSTGNDTRIVAGESGAAGMGGLLAVLNDPDLQEVKDSLDIGKNTNILIINTEGDTDPDTFEQAINTPYNNRLS